MYVRPLAVRRHRRFAASASTELPVAARAGRSLVRLAPYRESGQRLLIEALERHGNHAEALRELLHAQLGISPGPQLRAVHARLLESV
jgi:DNA-binding SARP family transcriptional activator